jgi:hypothetical protein
MLARASPRNARQLQDGLTPRNTPPPPPICIQDVARVQTSRARQHWAFWYRVELTEVGEVVRCGGHVAGDDDQFGGVMKPVTMACA